MSDKARGSVLLLAAAVTFLYYTFWTMLLPFFDESAPIHAWFPAREWAMRIVTFIVILGISAIGLFLGVRMIQDGAKELETERAKKSM